MMRKRTVWLSCLTVVAFVGGHATGIATPQKAEASRTDASFATRAEPGKMHKHLNRLDGTFQAAATFWVGDGEDRQEVLSTGTMTNTWILGGRFLEQRYTGTSGEMGGQGFEGFGLIGYSNDDDMYQTVWVDSTTTRISTSRQSRISDDGRRLTTRLTERDPLSGNEVDVKDVIEIQDRDHHSFTRYTVTPEGTEQKTMQVVYTRQ